MTRRKTAAPATSAAPAPGSVDGMIREIIQSSVDRYLGGLRKDIDALMRPAEPPRRLRGRPVVHPGCLVAGCRERHYAKGLCARHYQSARRARLAPRPSRRRAAARGRKGTIH